MILINDSKMCERKVKIMKQLSTKELKQVNGGGVWQAIKNGAKKVGNGIKDIGHGFSEGLDGW